MKAYLEYLRNESRRCYEQGLSSLKASQADRPWAVRRVARPGAHLPERRAGLPGIPRRTGGRALEFVEKLRFDPRSCEGARDRGRVLTSRQVQVREGQWRPLLQRLTRDMIRKARNISRLLSTLGVIGLVSALAMPSIASAADAPPPAEHRRHPRRRHGVRRHGRVRQRDQDAEPRLAGEGRRALHAILHAPRAARPPDPCC